MPSDASIYSMIRPQPEVAFIPPEERQMRQLKIRHLMDQGELSAMQRQRLVREMESEDATAAAYREAGGDPMKVRDILYGRGLYRPAMAAEKAALDAKEQAAKTAKTAADTGKATEETRTIQLKNLRDILAGVTDDSQLALWREETAKVLGPGAVAQMPQSVTDPRFAQIRQQYITTADKAIVSAEAKLADERARSEGAAGRGVTMRGQDVAAATTRRGQDLADARAAAAQEAGKWVNDMERGIQVNTTTGQTRPIMAGEQPIGPKDKELTDAQGKALLFSNRMEEADKIIVDLQKAGRTVSTPGSRTGYGVGAVVNTLNTASGQKLDQAKRNFINAVLRRESGAVISPSEFDNAEQQYFPQVGDSAAVIAQKAANRRTAIDGIKAEVPRNRRSTDSPAGGERKTIGNKKYVKVNGQWFEEN